MWKKEHTASRWLTWLRSKLLTLDNKNEKTFSFILYCPHLIVTLQLHLSSNAILINGNNWCTEHYIIKGVTDALFLVVSKLPQSNGNSKTLQGDCHGVYHILSVVCCEACLASTHTLRGVSILQTWMFLCLFNYQGCGRPRTANRQVWASTFFMCG